MRNRTYVGRGSRRRQLLPHKHERKYLLLLYLNTYQRTNGKCARPDKGDERSTL